MFDAFLRRVLPDSVRPGDPEARRRCGLLSGGVGIVLNLLLIKSMAHKGLALATTISGGVTLVMLLLVLRRKIGPLGLGRVFASLVKMAIATAGMCLAARPLYNLLYGKLELMPVCFLLAVLAGALVYAGLNVLLRTREMGVLVVGLLGRFFPN